MTARRSVRHHTVPQFYLRRFADYDERLRALNLESGEILERQHVRNVAVEKGFHTLADAGDPTLDIEALFGQVEGELAEGLRSIDKRFPPTPEARAAISLFVAFQFVRSSRTRKVIQDTLSDVMKWSAKFEASYALNKLPPDTATAYVRERLSRDDITPDEATELLETLSEANYDLEIDPSEHLQQMLDVLTDPEYAEMVNRRSWAMCYTDARHEFLISDHPVAVAGSPFPSGHAGLRNALELSLPVDRRRLLLMTLDPNDEGKRREVSAAEAQGLNRRARDSALRFVYGHPLVTDGWLRGETE